MNPSNNTYIAHNGKDPVPACAACAKGEKSMATVLAGRPLQATPESSPQRPPSRGWRLANGTVICAPCNPKPGKATAVILQDAADGHSGLKIGWQCRSRFTVPQEHHRGRHG